MAARQIRSMTRTTGKAPVAELNGFTTGVRVRWSDIDMYQHINHATMVTILEARVDFLREPFAEDIGGSGLLIHEVQVLYKGQLRLVDSPLQVTIWTKRLRASTSPWAARGAVGGAAPDSKPP